MKKGFFITFEGTDGVGKTTHVRRLESWLRKKKRKVLVTREPGGDRVAEKIRKILLNPNNKIQDLTELFLYQAARVEHVQTKIRPHLKKGFVVLCDRFTDATVAYQGYGRGLPVNMIRQLNKVAGGGLVPDLTILLDLSPTIGLKKARNRKKEHKGDRLEKEGFRFQNRVRKGYLALAQKHPSRIKVIFVKESIHDTQHAIRTLLGKVL